MMQIQIVRVITGIRLGYRCDYRRRVFLADARDKIVDALVGQLDTGKLSIVRGSTFARRAVFIQLQTSFAAGWQMFAPTRKFPSVRGSRLIHGRGQEIAAAIRRKSWWHRRSVEIGHD